MTGYVGRRSAEHIGIVNDFVDDELTKFVTKLIDSYADIPYSLTKCGLVYKSYINLIKNSNYLSIILLFSVTLAPIMLLGERFVDDNCIGRRPI